MVGTWAMAFLNAASAMPLIASKPARINSLFLTSTPKAMARFFISLICINSVLGRVKLSRTTLTFFSLAALAALVGATDSFLSAAWLGLTGLDATLGWVCARGLAGAAGLATKAVFALTGGALGILEAVWLTFFRGVLAGGVLVAAFFVGAVLADRLGVGAGTGVSPLAAGWAELFMVNRLEGINGAYSLYR